MSDNSDFKKMSNHSTPEESPGLLLWRVSTQWRTAIEKTLKLYNLTHPQFVVLAASAWLAKHEKYVSQATISRFTELDPNTISQILRGLETKKLIKRTQKIDERSKNPMLTTVGLEVLSQALPAVERADEEFFNKLTKQESQETIEIFKKLLMLS